MFTFAWAKSVKERDANTKYAVDFNDSVPEVRRMSCGVPQGYEVN